MSGQAIHVANFSWQFPILSLQTGVSAFYRKTALQMLSRLPAGALKKASAFGAATRSASVSVSQFARRGHRGDIYLVFVNI
jgi:hypothetical protein